MTLSILVGCYGDFPDYSIRCVQSILEHTKGDYQLFVGCNACGSKTTEWLQAKYKQGDIKTLVFLRQNINKSPMLRFLLPLVDTPYLVWFDDDSHIIQEGWDLHLAPFLEAEKPDVAGQVYFCHRQKESDYERFLKRRPWYAGRATQDAENRVWFATGGLWAGRTAFLKYHNFPDPGIIKKSDDLLLGELCEQHNGKLSGFPSEVMDAIKISDGERRGSGEDKDGWRDIT